MPHDYFATWYRQRDDVEDGCSGARGNKFSVYDVRSFKQAGLDYPDFYASTEPYFYYVNPAKPNLFQVF